MKYAINKLTDKPRYTFEYNSQMTITKPDFALSVRTIMTKFAQGLPLPIAGTGYFSRDFPDVKKMDIIDLWKMKRDNDEAIKQLEAQRDKLNEDVIEYKQGMHLKEIERKIAERYEQKNTNSKT